jgi:hypothetical protein
MQTLEEKKAHLERRRDAYLQEFAVPALIEGVKRPLVDMFEAALSGKTPTLDVSFTIIVTNASRDGDELVLLQKQVARHFLLAFRRRVNWVKVSANDIIRLRMDDKAEVSPYDSFNDPEALIIIENTIPSAVKIGDQWINDIVESRAVQHKPTLFVTPIHSEVFLPNRHIFSADGSLRKLRFTIPLDKPPAAACTPAPRKSTPAKPPLSNL